MFFELGLLAMAIFAVATLTIAVILERINDLKEENTFLKMKLMAIEISDKIKKGDVNIVRVGLLGDNYSGFRPELGEIDIEADEISDEIQKGDILELEDY